VPEPASLRFAIELRPAAVRALSKIDSHNRERIKAAIILLGVDPYPPGMKKLQGRDGYRVRVGDYRILYFVENQKLILVVVTIGHRKDVYRRS
jgi:mRNA interferase RelE/StbE